ARVPREIKPTRKQNPTPPPQNLSPSPVAPTNYTPPNPPNPNDVLLMQEFSLEDRRLAFFCTLTTFGTPRDLTLAELTIVAFHPANSQTAEALAAAVSKARPG